MIRRGKLLKQCITFYILGLAWFFLFPAVSLSSGELKPRGMFVDENAFLTTTVPFEKISHPSTSSGQRNVTEMVDFFTSEGYCVHVDRNVFSFIVEPRNSPTGPEVSVLVFKLCGDIYPQWILDIIVSLSHHLRASRWMSKSVLVLIVSAGTDSTSPPLARWLSRYHTRPFIAGSMGFHNESPMFYGLIRDALVLDMQSCTPSSPDRPSAPALPTVWPQGYELAFIGANGQLPNMDVISSLLSMQSRYISFRHDRAWDSLFGASSPVRVPSGWGDYMDHFRGLLSFCAGLFTGPDGWHSHFLHYNIDSMTLKPLTGDGDGTRTAKSRKVSKGGAHATLAHFLSVVISIVRINSNLHGKCHCIYILAYTL